MSWVQDQLRWGRNLRESKWTRARRLLWGFRYWLRGIRLGLRAMRRVQLGSTVIYEGERWGIYNWAGSPSSSLRRDRDGECRERVPATDFRPVVSPRELLHRFRVIRRWYMGYWHSIDVNKRLSRDAGGAL